jgi:hypothetical protein
LVITVNIDTIMNAANATMVPSVKNSSIGAHFFSIIVSYDLIIIK